MSYTRMRVQSTGELALAAILSFFLYVLLLQALFISGFTLKIIHYKNYLRIKYKILKKEQ